MAREHGDDRILADYLETFDEVMHSPMERNKMVASSMRHA
jgi:hypothetical protein